MKTMPFHLGTIHFIGIGGIGMSGIAEILFNLGHRVQGSDVQQNSNISRLKEKGIDVKIGHSPENLAGVQVVVISSAIKADNAELIAARTQRIPVVRRAEMLAELMRLKWSVAVAGTHGKTTTTSLVAALLDGANMDPTVVNGGIINAYGTNARLGKGDWIVVEADESDGTFTRLMPTLAVVTNIDPEHLDHYGSVEALHDSFNKFASNIPFYGCGILCIDHPEVQKLISHLGDRRIITYGFNNQAEIRAENIKLEIDGCRFDVVIAGRDKMPARRIDRLELPMLGKHNIQNALAAIAVAVKMEIPTDKIRAGFSKFKGVKRRLTLTGKPQGIAIYDDYAHHPVEIRAVLSALRPATRGRLIAVFQPHRFSRLRDLFDDFCTSFNDADQVFIADVYAAGESPIEDYDKAKLVRGLQQCGHNAVKELKSADSLPQTISETAKSGDTVICMGAGSITIWASSLPEKLTGFHQSSNYHAPNKLLPEKTK